MLIALFVFAVSANLVASEVNLAKTDQTAKFMPTESDYTVELYVDRVDCKATKFGLVTPQQLMQWKV